MATEICQMPTFGQQSLNNFYPQQSQHYQQQYHHQSYQNGYNHQNSQYNQQQQQQRSNSNHQQQTDPDMLIVQQPGMQHHQQQQQQQQQYYNPTEQQMNGRPPAGDLHQKSMNHGLNQSVGRSQYHPNMPHQAILYGSYVDPNMIPQSGSSRNTSPGNAENERKSNTNLYIRGLNPSDTDDTIRQLVAENANIPADAINSTKAVLDEQSGQCKGYGFVDFRDEAQAQQALEALVKASLRSGKLQINYARESEKDPTNIYIKNLPTRPECNEEWMSKMFTEDLARVITGRIISCRVMRATDPNTRQQTSATGAGFIRFEKDADATLAISYINKNGSQLATKYASSRALEAKLADKTNQRKKQRAQSDGRSSSTVALAAQTAQASQLTAAGNPSAIPQLNAAAAALFQNQQQNAAMVAAAARSGAVIPSSYATLLPSGTTALYQPGTGATAHTAYRSHATAATPSSYVMQTASSATPTAPQLYQPQRSWMMDPSYAAAGLYAPQLLPQTSSLYDANTLAYYSAAAGLGDYQLAGGLTAEQQ